MKNTARGVAMAGLLSAVAAASPGEARAEGPIWLSAEVPVFGVHHVVWDDRPGPLPNTTIDGGEATTLSFLSNCLYASFVAGCEATRFGVGYKLNDVFLIGGRMGFAFGSTNVPAGPGSSVTADVGIFRLMPRFELQFGKNKVRPFVAFEPAFGLSWASVRTTSGSVTGSSAETQGHIAGAVNGGVHIFLTDSFSLSPYAEFNSSRIVKVASDSPTDYVPEGAQVGGRVGLLFSGWLGK
jgi:hypothetical protein